MGFKLALVTGSTSGIGEACARALLERGWRVVGVGRREFSVEHAAYRQLRVDLSNPAEAQARIEAEVSPLVADPDLERLGLVNNAAAASPGKLEYLDATAIQSTLTLDLVVPMWLMAWTVRRTPDATPTRIVNVSSGASTRPLPGLGVYCTAKAGLLMAGRVFAVEVGLAGESGSVRDDTTLLSYRPGTVDTAMQGEAREMPAERFPVRHLFRQWAEEGSLLPPPVPAAEIADYLDGDGWPDFGDCGPGELATLHIDAHTR